MDHFALPDDELALAQERGTLHRNFMGYTTHADSDLVGSASAPSATSARPSARTRANWPTWQGAVDEGRLPVFRGMRLSEDDMLRADLIQHLMCQRARFR